MTSRTFAWNPRNQNPRVGKALDGGGGGITTSEYVSVEDLKTHLKNCGFAPVLCSNEECGMEINKAREGPSRDCSL